MKKLLITFFLLITITGFSQNGVFKNQLQVSGFIHNGKVLLRWVPNNPISWQRGNKLGYSVYRRVVMSDGKVIEKPDSILMGVYKPFALEDWKPFADSNYFAIAAEAIHGSGFEITAQSSSTFFEMVNKSREQESRFSIGLLCADKSFTVAKMMGLGFEDTNTKSNEAYLYKVVLNYSDTSGQQEIGFAMVDYGYGNFLPRPFGINHEVNQNVVTIMVPYEPFKGIYNTYELQRSDDKKAFEIVKDISYYSLNTSAEDPTYNIYNDSVISKTSIVYYRLRGRTSFDTFGPYSDTLEVKIMPTLNGEPWITDIKEVGTGKLIVTWDTPKYIPENLKGFMLYFANKYEGPYFQSCKMPVENSARSIGVDVPADYAYFRIGALDQFNRPYFSAPRLYQAVDSIPPKAPIGLSGVFDTTGVAKFKWSYSKERDLLGYQLLYTANPDAEYSLINNEFIYDSTYSTKFSKGTLNSELYFKVVALDTRYNTSIPSLPIKLVKPDTIPPSSPLIFINTDSAGLVKVFIAPSLSSDIKLHSLYFETEGDNSYKKALFKGDLKVDTSIVLPENIDRGRIYCVAEDITNRKGVSNSVKVNNFKIQENQTFNVLVKPLIDEGAVELRWDSKNLIGSVMIYRKDDINEYILIATISFQEEKYRDKSVTVNTSYSYKLIALNNMRKVISKVVRLNFK